MAAVDSSTSAVMASSVMAAEALRLPVARSSTSMATPGKVMAGVGSSGRREMVTVMRVLSWRVVMVSVTVTRK